MIWLSPIWMAFWSRAAGGGWPKLPWNCDQILYALPYFALWSLAGWWTVLIVIGEALGKLAGTRQYLDMGYDKQPIRNPNKYDFLIKWLKPQISDYWYDAIGNTVIGLAGSLLTVVILSLCGHNMAAMYIGIYAAFRGLAYVIGWSLIPEYHNPKFPKGIQYATEIAEYLSGFFAGLGLLLAVVLG